MQVQDIPFLSYWNHPRRSVCILNNKKGMFMRTYNWAIRKEIQSLWRKRPNKRDSKLGKGHSGKESPKKVQLWAFAWLLANNFCRERTVLLHSSQYYYQQFHYFSCPLGHRQGLQYNTCRPNKSKRVKVQHSSIIFWDLPSH